MSVLVNGRPIGHLGDISSGKTAQSISAPLTPEALTAFPSNAKTRLDVDWQIIPAGYETNAANNSYSHTFLICGPTAHDPRCANAKSRALQRRVTTG